MKRFLLLLVAIIFAVAGCTQASNEATPMSPTKQGEVTGNTMKVHFLNVGQGDSIFIQSPNDKREY